MFLWHPVAALIWATLCLLGTFLLAALGDLVSEEVRGWLDLAPRAILRLAAARLDPGLQESVYQEEWLPELIYVLRGAESRPITRLLSGVRFALGLLFSARGIARHHVPTSHPTVPLHRPREMDATSFIVGVGTGASEMAKQLARLGVGHLRLVDPDTIHSQNLPRYFYPPDQY
jgi:hypothetical protein